MAPMSALYGRMRISHGSHEYAHAPHEWEPWFPWMHPMTACVSPMVSMNGPC